MGIRRNTGSARNASNIDIASQVSRKPCHKHMWEMSYKTWNHLGLFYRLWFHPAYNVGSHAVILRPSHENCWTHIHSINLHSEVMQRACLLYMQQCILTVVAWVRMLCICVVYHTPSHMFAPSMDISVCKISSTKKKKNRIRFDWCKSLIWLLLVMQACTQQLLCDNLIFLYVLICQIFLLHYTEKKLCRVL